jgi:hypothetical protein
MGGGGGCRQDRRGRADVLSLSKHTVLATSKSFALLLNIFLLLGRLFLLIVPPLLKGDWTHW